MRHICFISLGSNLGNRKRNLEKAIRILRRLRAVTVLKSSSIYETSAWGRKRQPNFYNMVLKCSTHLSPSELLIECLYAEMKCGRKRSSKFGPRVVDIDLLTYGRQSVRINSIEPKTSHAKELLDSGTVKELSLHLPHPLMFRRRFVLEPLHEIAPRMKIRRVKIAEYLKALPKRQLCKNICKPSRRSLR